MKKNIRLVQIERKTEPEKKHFKKLQRKGKKYNRYASSIIRKIGTTTLIKAPEVFSIYSIESKERNSSYEDTMAFISEAKTRFKTEQCLLDFRETRIVTAAAVVVLFAELEDIIANSNLRHKIGWSSNSQNANQALRNSGLSRLINKRSIASDLKSLEKLPVIKGVGRDRLEEILDHIQERVYKNQMDPDTEWLFGDAVSETINNVGRHAYPTISDDQKEWWLICEVINEQLYLAIYDRGVGIPKTVVEQPWFLFSLKSTYPEQYDSIMNALKGTNSNFKFYAIRRLKDSELIYISMQGDVTGTKQSKHGQGSKSIKALVSDTDGGKLWVFSKKGLYKFEKDDVTPQLFKLPKEFSGTLLQWNINIK